MALFFYSLVALIPIAAVFVLLVMARRPAGQAMPLAYLITVVIALVVWRVPFVQVAASSLQGAVAAAEILYIVFGAILLLNTARIGSHHSYSPELTGHLSGPTGTGDYHCLAIRQLH
jgi:L-lactate permease